MAVSVVCVSLLGLWFCSASLLLKFLWGFPTFFGKTSSELLTLVHANHPAYLFLDMEVNLNLI